jgi:Recombination enhancement, RecA-dependent nuclease
MKKKPTTNEKLRMDLIAQLGCLPCRLQRMDRQATVQHVTEGGRRLGHAYTYGSCPWHHQVKTENDMTNQEMIGLFGPSFAHSRREFEATYGDERNVLVRLQTWVNQHPSHYYHELHGQWEHLQRTN